MAMDPSQGPALPPDIMAAMAGGGAPPAPAPAAPAGPDPSDASGSQNLQFLQDAIDAAKQYADGEDDQIHVQTAMQCIAKLQSILAEEQKGADELLSGKATPRTLRRAASASGPGQ